MRVEFAVTAFGIVIKQSLINVLLSICVVLVIFRYIQYPMTRTIERWKKGHIDLHTYQMRLRMSERKKKIST